MNKIRKYVFDFMRWFWWDDYDPDEEFSCGHCGKQVLRRILFCSEHCSKEFSKEIKDESNE